MQATQYFNAFAHGIWFLHSFTHTYVCIVCSNIFTRNILKNFTLTFVFRCEGKSSLTLFHLATKKIFSVASSRRLPEKVNFRPWINHSSYFHKLNRCEIKALKKFMLDPYSDPWKIIYWNCEEIYEDMIDQHWINLNPWPLHYPRKNFCHTNIQLYHTYKFLYSHSAPQSRKYRAEIIKMASTY